jgi:ACT domain-containing protein
MPQTFYGYEDFIFPHNPELKEQIFCIQPSFEEMPCAFSFDVIGIDD